MSFITANFLLQTEISQKIYQAIKGLPICDYHCHLNEKEILEDKPFENFFELTLKYDHYKWRLMRFAGVDESYITGNKSPKEKFIKYCEVLATAFGNPLYHWSQMEIEKYFNCTLELNKDNAEKIWDFCNAYIKENELSPVKLIQQSNVKYICTTNKMFDDLGTFEKINTKNLGFKVYPTYRPDDFLDIECDNFVNLLEQSRVTSFDSMLSFLENKLDEFILAGCKVVDISIIKIFDVATKRNALNVFNKRLTGQELTIEEIAYYKGYMIYFFMQAAAEKDLAVELHLGATRNNNTKIYEKIGSDAGCDAIGEENTINGLCNLLDKLNLQDCLGKVIIFNLNQKDNKQLLALSGSFSSFKSKIQYGPAWWFLDNYEGIMQHFKDLCSFGHFGSFIGMLTDSRSFLSYSRHDYFRRILANFLGKLVKDELITQDLDMVIKVAKNVSYHNAIEYFNFK